MATPTVYTPKPLITPLLLPGATTTLYTAPAAGAQLTALVACDVTQGGIAVTLWAVPSGGSVQDGYAVVKDYALPTDGGGYNLLPGGLFFMNPGDTIRGIAGSGSSVAVHLHGVEFQ